MYFGKRVSYKKQKNIPFNGVKEKDCVVGKRWGLIKTLTTLSTSPHRFCLFLYLSSLLPHSFPPSPFFFLLPPFLSFSLTLYPSLPSPLSPPYLPFLLPPFLLVPFLLPPFLLSPSRSLLSVFFTSLSLSLIMSL